MSGTAIDGLLLVDLTVHGDDRGWFKENWQREKMIELGLPDFGPVQHNVSFNATAGTTRGIHAEPWDKLVSVAAGRVFGAWVDLREGPGFGTLVTAEIGPDRAVFIPRGVANAFQTLEDGTTYSYLVNAHWSPDAVYTFVNLQDPTLAVPWPLPLVEVSDKDRAHPALADVIPVRPRGTLVIGAEGQLGRALRDVIPEATFLTESDLDLTDTAAIERLDVGGVDTVINAAAYTAVDVAETPEGRQLAWAINVTAVAALARLCIAHRLAFVNVSSDYVFDGEAAEHAVDEPVSPLGVYGQTKAAGEAVTSTVPRHHLVRTSWVVGDGRNFVDTMRRLARDGVSPRVVDDQFGRLTPASHLAKAIVDLVRGDAPYGVHHVTGDGPIESWADVARRIFAEEGRDPADVTGISTEQYATDQQTKGHQTAPRPRNSTLARTGPQLL
ncbi:sugar nucleotide-binding protein [Aeromicrobium sp. CF3.5]|uniref:sugar nucleotide-binding protein n=1 Tax=Aeromicrobium sp. CF3.5 TaxID=3373078 RepID=UPI003EE6FD88